jgi:hypothetical protein
MFDFFFCYVWFCCLVCKLSHLLSLDLMSNSFTIEQMFLDFATSLVTPSPKNINYTPIDQDNFIVLYFFFFFKYDNVNSICFDLSWNVGLFESEFVNRLLHKTRIELWWWMLGGFECFHLVVTMKTSWHLYMWEPTTSCSHMNENRFQFCFCFCFGELDTFLS